MQIERCQTATEAGARAAALILARLRAAVAERGSATIAFSGGHTPMPMFDALRAAPMSWRRVHVFQTDERIVAIDDDRSNLKAILATFGDTDLPSENLHCMLDAEAASSQLVQDYERRLRAAAGSPPVLDVVHLGLGTDGHTASLVPGDAAVDAVGNVVLSREYAGLRRMSLTLPALNRARSRIFLVTGTDKRDSVRRLLAQDPHWVASRVRRDGTVVVVDDEAEGDAE
jgi:6-phosphogluconolactonase